MNRRATLRSLSSLLDHMDDKRDDKEEQLEDAEELAAVKGDMDVNMIGSSKKARLEDAEEIQTAVQ